jgi:DNA-directed RNA polymerase specialized sigma24 family protein
MTTDPSRTEQLLEAVLAIMVAEREARLGSRDDKRSEILLAEAGLPLTDVAKLTGKNYGAVAKAVQRYRSASKTGSESGGASNGS